MALQKQPITINFSQGLDTKTDPWQVQAGKFLDLQNTVFNKGGLLQKRNGFGALTTLSSSSSTTLTTFDGNLLAIGNRLNILSEDNNNWYDKGPFQPIDLNVISVVRTSQSQTTVDSATHPSLLSCITYLDSSGSAYYQIVDSQTGQIIISQVALPTTATLPRVFTLGIHFVITFLVNVGSTPHLKYIAIPVNIPTLPTAAIDISTQVSSLTTGYDGVVANNNLYLAWTGSDIGGAIRLSYIDSTLLQHRTTVVTGYTSDLMTLTADTSSNTAIIWASFWESGSMNGYSSAYDHTLLSVLSPTQTIDSILITEMTSSAQSGTLTLFYEVSNTYDYSMTRSDFVSSITCSQSGSVGTPSIVLRGVGLASKSFYFSTKPFIYLLVTYGGAFQPTYFLIDQNGNMIAKLAYSNGSGYASTQILPSISLNGNFVQLGYLFKTLLVSVNKAQGVENTAGIYAQDGINLVTFTFNPTQLISSEIGNNLNISGGFLSIYDGNKLVEQNFNLWPEDILVTTSTMGGNLSNQQYYYYVTYEWTDSQGNLNRSAPSIPYGIVTTGTTSANTLNIPTLRITYKESPNPIRIVIYRWSEAQQIPYQITSISSPLLNDPTVDSITYVDLLSDADILGNVILYTNGGIVEDIGPPATPITTLFKSRMILLDAEDRNLLWYSKQVIEATPVEMSDLFTIYVAPTISAQGSTGPITALSAMDDKLIIFKKDAIYYLTGNGPDNTGANNDFSDPTFITSTVGCANQNSIVFMPQGLLFQSDKGIWLLGRDLSTNYIGAPVEKYNSSLVLSAINVPATNQVRFTIDNGLTLMYDYYYAQWGTFTGVPAISTTIYQSLPTYLNAFGQVYQETPGLYLDGSNPVLMSFITSWFNLAGLNGFQRAYYFYLLGNYISPHKLNIQISYDYSPYPIQTSMISPTNYSPPYGGDSLYGGSSPYGGSGTVENWRIFLQKQKCTSFQILLNEIFDPSFGTAAGAGFTLSGLDLVIGVKSGYPRLNPANSVG